MNCLFVFFLLMSAVQATMNARILKTAIFDFAPNLRLHHIVIITNTPKRQFLRSKDADTYAVDFGHEGREFKTKLLLLLGKSVTGEVRIRKLSARHRTDKELLDEWIEMTMAEPVALSRKITETTFNQIDDNELREFLGKFLDWNGSKKMNLYRSNCQHFGGKIIAGNPGSERRRCSN